MNSQDVFHVFNLHSHIMYLVAKAVIRHRGLDPSRCAFVFTRGYRTPDDGEDGIARYPFPFPNWELAFYYGKDHERVRSNIAKIEKFIDTLTGGKPFHYYAQHTCSYYVNIIASYEKCISYSFLEEGIASYVDEERLVKLIMGNFPPRDDPDMVASNGSRLNTFERRFYNVSHPKFGYAYGVSPDSFPTAPKEKRVYFEDVFHPVELKKTEEGDAILILGNERWAQLQKPLGHAKFRKMLMWFVQNVLVAKGYRRVLYKLRNDTLQSDLNVYNRVFSENPQIEFVKIGDAHVLENVIKTLDVPVFVIASACGEYACQMGRDVYSLAKLYRHFDPGYAKTEHWFCVEHLEASGAKFIQYAPPKKKKPSDKIVYSFDIYDTLLTRKTATPGGIFTIIQDRLRKEYRKEYPVELVENFFYFRRLAEYVRYQKAGLSEISLEEIYRELNNLFKYVSWDPIKRIMDMEVEEEIRQTVPIEENIGKIRELLCRGERVVLISDMYLPEDVIRTILEKTDPVLGECTLYLSSAVGRKKARTGELFKYVCARENIRPENLRHVGDNESSDIAVPKSMGIGTSFYQTSAIHPVERRYLNEKSLFHQLIAGVSKRFRIDHPDASKLAAVGAMVSAPILYGYVDDVLKKAVAKGIKTLYFFARDGQVMLKIAKVINEAKNLDLDLRYLYCSRQSVLPAGIFWTSTEIYDWVFIQFTQITFRDFADRLELNPEKLLQAFPKHVRERIPGFDTKLDRDVIELLKATMCKTPAVRVLVEERAKRLRKLFIDYLKQEGVFDGGTIGIVDIGWKGLVQNMFFKIAASHKPDFKMVGFYFSFSSTCHHGYSHTNGRENYVESILPMTDLNPAFLVNFMETLCCSDHGTTLRYERKNNGEIVPVFSDNGFADPALIHDYHAALEWWSREYAAIETQFPDLPFTSKAILWKLVSHCSNPDADVAEAFGSLNFSGHQSDHHMNELAPVLGVLDVLRYYLTIGTKRQEVSWWLPGSVARSSRTVRCLNSLMKGLCQVYDALGRPVYRYGVNTVLRGIRLARRVAKLLVTPFAKAFQFVGRIFALPAAALVKKLVAPMVVRCVRSQGEELKKARNRVIDLEIRLAENQVHYRRLARTLDILEEEFRNIESIPENDGEIRKDDRQARAA